MMLDILDNIEPAWYSSGLRFTCTQCGNCCTGGPGYVWITEEEIGLLAAELKLSVAVTKKRYCRRIGQRYSLKEHRNRAGLYDCIFLKEIPPEPAGDGEQSRIEQPRRVCSVYHVRPLQCRTWPFWISNLSTPEAWRQAATRCPGIREDGRKFTREQIETIRDSAQWPQDPPGSL